MSQNSRRIATLSPRIPLSKVLIFGATFIAAGIFLHSITRFHSTSNPLHTIPHQSSSRLSTISDAFRTLFDQIRLPVDAESYTDLYGETFPISEDGPYWKEPLRNRIAIVDIDTRIPDGENELWSEGRMNWDKMTDTDTGRISAGQMNHFLYAQIHGYDYRFLHTARRPDLDPTWVKPFIFESLLPHYQFVIVLDADASFPHLEVPLEWMFNRWNIGPDTSIAMPVDVRQDMGGNHNIGVDDRGNMEQNSGVIIAQNLPYTFEMLKAWTECPTEVRYEGCARWRHEWAHEQRAFALYIRYDFNPNGTNIVEIPCNEAMGFPGLGDNGWIADNCTGQFIRHYTIAKQDAKRSTELAMLQAFTDLSRKELLQNRDAYLVHDTLAEEESKTEEARIDFK